MADFGVPQSRKRVMIYGIRDDLDIKSNLENMYKVEDKKTNKDVVEFSLENALKIDKQEIIDEIEKGKYIEDKKNKDKEYGKPPTNLKKCYDKGEI